MRNKERLFIIPLHLSPLLLLALNLFANDQTFDRNGVQNAEIM